jgi:hypothetical protein
VSVAALPLYTGRRIERILVMGLALAVVALEPSAAFAQTWTCGSGACTTTGLVGVNTPSPGASIDVSYGDIRTLAPNTGFVIQAPDFWSPGWARGLNFTNSNNTVLAQFGAYGYNAPSTLNYAYVGASYNSPWMAFKPNGNVGLGTISPGKKIEISAGDGATSMGDTNVALLLRNTNGYLSRSAIDFYGNLPATNVWRYAAVEGLVTGEGAGGDIGAILFGTKASIVDTTLTERMRVDSTGNIGIGVSNPQSKLSVNGKISASEVVVTSTPADYVFESGYRLAPLSEVAEYVRANHHLPDIPAGKEIEAKGVSLGDMQSKLLAKIEELTLHMIEMEKEDRALRERVAQMESAAAAAGPGEQRNRSLPASAEVPPERLK